MKITVLMGGWSAERKVSLWTGEQVAAGLERLGHEIEKFDLTHDSVHALPELSKCDLVFNALHGPGGEDGVIAGFLETLGIPHTHSGVFASAVAMDKHTTRRLATLAGVQVAAGRLISLSELSGHPIPPPYVIKPRYEGSTIGVTVVMRDAPPPLGKWPYRGEPLVEAFIPGQELSVGLLHGTAIGIVEIIPGNAALFDFDAKYLDRSTQHIIPARIPDPIRTKALTWSETLWAELGCCDVARADYRYDPALGDDGLFFLEMNTHPGLMSTSLLPDIASAHGLSYDMLLHRIIQRHGRRRH